MFAKIRSSVKLFLKDRLIQISVTLALTASIFTFYIFGIVGGVSVFLTYLGGYISFGYVFDYRLELTSAVSAAAKTLRSNRDKHAKEESCNACGDKDCKREKIVQKHKPWEGLMIPRQVDQAFESLLDRTLAEFVGSWYKNVSVDDSFPAELRYNIRYCTSAILSRALKVNIGKFLGVKVVPAFLKHLQYCKEMDGGNVDPIYHPAVFNRAAEMEYLRLRVNQILPFLLEKPQLECSMLRCLVVEVLSGWVLLPLASTADPAVPNSLLLLLLNQNLTATPPTHPSDKVEFLAKFAHSSSGLQSNSALMADMCNIMKDRSLLCWFMQFLKDRGSLHILQFCLDVEEFNRRMLSPELKPEEMDTLYRDAWDLYSVYFSPHSPDNIGFPPDLVLQMRKVLSKDVTKLRTSPPLFQAYEHAYSLLDRIYCPLFHTSDEFYMWLCGPRTPHNHSRSGSRRTKKNEGAVLKLTNKVQKIKGALRAQTLDGQALETTTIPLEAAAEFGEELSEEDVERDMSCWKVKIIGSENKLDPTTGKPGIIFSIQVEAWAPEGAHGGWTIERRIGDFYTLEAKLSEFHGEFSENKLPSSGILSPNPPTLPQIYEGYLEKLLRTPGLRGSEMLHWFLTSPVDFYMEENAIGKLLKRSVGTLRKERGQNLDSFIAAYMGSTESKNKPKLEWKDVNYELSPRRKRCLTNSVFKNNLSLPMDSFQSCTTLGRKIKVPSINSPTDSFIYLGDKVLKLPEFVMRICLCLIDLLKSQLDNLFCNYLERRITTLLAPPRAAHLINLLQWVVYDKRTKSDPKEVLQSLNLKLSRMKGYTGNLYRAVFQSLQNPMYNKQLFYTLLDIALDELFPELISK